MDRFPGTRQPVPMRAAAALLAAVLGCAGARAGMTDRAGDPAGMPDPYAGLRKRMVTEQIQRRGVRDPRVLRAMTSVPRHLFVPEAMRGRAYDDTPLPIGQGQTISQPYIVAFMTEAVRPGPEDRVLEIGTGSGYQAAVLAAIVKEVFTIEIHEELARAARERLAGTGHHNVTVRHGDGYFGWPEHAPFDAIVVTAAPASVPQPLLDQLKAGGRMVIPVDRDDAAGAQDLVRYTRTETGFERETLLPVRFVPMTGESRRPD
jgi:protein-L-isoaspartate(D-aspartate) O-methyltransferase